jgi:hypothetical protein
MERDIRTMMEFTIVAMESYIERRCILPTELSGGKDGHELDEVNSISRRPVPCPTALVARPDSRSERTEGFHASHAASATETYPAPWDAVREH